MNKYLVKLAELHYRPIEVIADNEEDARKLARDKVFNNEVRNETKYAHTLEEEKWDTEFIEEVTPPKVKPNETKIVVVEFNIRPKKENTNVKFHAIGFECGEHTTEAEELKNAGIDLNNVCLVDFDIEGFNQSAQLEVVYDRLIVRTNRSIEHWVNLFK